MSCTKFLLALVGVALLVGSAPLRAQLNGPADYSNGAGTWPNFNIYKPANVPPTELGDSPRLDQLIRDGKLYLSLSDAIALALENNLDISIARFGPKEADADILRARGGGAIRGVQTGVSSASTGASAAGPGATGPPGQATGFTEFGGQTTGGGGGQALNLDPTFTSSLGWNHFSQPQASDFVLGQNTRVRDLSSQNLTYSQAFRTGTSFQLGFSNFGTQTNSLRDNFNPTLNSNMSLTVRQRLTQGFGRDVNSINIRVARNNREISDLAFQQQVMSTVQNIQTLYWDLVGFVAQVNARQRDLEVSETLLRDNKRKVELGLLAAVEVVRSQAQVATSRNQLVQAQSTVREQEVTLKNAISKNGPAGLSEVGIVPTDRIVIPEIDAVEPVQDLISLALQARPNLVQSRMQLTNSEIRIKGVRNAMLPTLDLTGTATNNALAGRVNQDLEPIPGVGAPNPFFVGGFGTVLSQLFSRNFPDYGVQLQLTIPLKNRQAQADMTSELLARRRQEIQLRQQENQVKVEVTQALVRLQQARESYESAREGRELQENLLQAEEKRFSLGSSNNFQIIQVQQDLANARIAEITAMTSYIKARAELDFATGRALERNNVSIDEAYTGQVSKNPDPLPPE